MPKTPIRILGLKQESFGLIRSMLLYRPEPLSNDQLEGMELAASIVRSLADSDAEADHAGMLYEAIRTARIDHGTDDDRSAMLKQLIRESFDEMDNRYDSSFEDEIEVRKIRGFPSTDYMPTSDRRR